MAERAEGETRADVARRPTVPETSAPPPTRSAPDDPDGRAGPDDRHRLTRRGRPARRIVVKVGSSSLTTAAGGIDPDRVRRLVEVLAGARAGGAEVVLVSSGAIAAGLAPLGLSRRPQALAAQQAAASVGQGLLVHRYTEELARHGIVAGQVLLTNDDMTRRSHYRNAYQTFAKLLELGVLPIVNENDTVATSEIRFGDNDRLAALVAHLVHADLLVLLSDVDGLYDGDPASRGSRLVPEVAAARRPRRRPDRHVRRRRGRHRRHAHQGRGGPDRDRRRHPRRPHLRRAGRRRPWPVSRSAPSSTPPAGAARPGCSGWPTPPSRAGRLLLDDGAVRAVTERRASLLAAGITGVAGSFVAGDPVDLADPDGRPVARGLVNFDADEIPSLLGRSSHELKRELGAAYEREVVHRDDLVLLLDPGGLLAR